MAMLSRCVSALALAAAMLTAGCIIDDTDDDHDGRTRCSQLCVGDDGSFETCDVYYDFAALTDVLQSRPDLVAQLGFGEVRSCGQAEAVSRYVID